MEFRICFYKNDVLSLVDTSKKFIHAFDLSKIYFQLIHFDLFIKTMFNPFCVL